MSGGEADASSVRTGHRGQLRSRPSWLMPHGLDMWDTNYKMAWILFEYSTVVPYLAHGFTDAVIVTRVWDMTVIRLNSVPTASLVCRLLSHENKFRLDFSPIVLVLIALNMPLISSSCTTMTPALLEHVQGPHCWVSSFTVPSSAFAFRVDISILVMTGNAVTPLTLDPRVHLLFSHCWRSWAFLVPVFPAQVKCSSAYLSFYFGGLFEEEVQEDADSVQQKT